MKKENNKKAFHYTVVTDKKMLEVNKKTYDFIQSLDNSIDKILKGR